MSTLIFDNTVIGSYELGELLGSGGMGMVYRAYQPKLDRYVALKIFLSTMKANSNLDQRFIREAEIIASLEHPHIVPIYDFGSTDALRYVAMRLLTGGTLSDLLEGRRKQRKPYSPSEVTRLLMPIADAIDYAHSKGIVHRDIKPSNIMFDERGWPYLVDFGIARMTNGASSLTRTGSALGTPAYMPPEQWMGKEATAPSDVYALGAVIFEMLTLRQPFEHENPFELMQMHINKPAPFPHDITPGLSPEVGSTVYQALQKDTTERFPSAGAFANAFSKATQGFAAVPLAFDRPTQEPVYVPPKPIVPDRPTGATPLLKEALTSSPHPEVKAEEKKRRLPLLVGVLLLGIVACGGTALLLPGFLKMGDGTPALSVPAVTGTLTASPEATTEATETPVSPTATETLAPSTITPKPSQTLSSNTMTMTATLQNSPAVTQTGVPVSPTPKPAQATSTPIVTTKPSQTVAPTTTSAGNPAATATSSGARVVPTSTPVVPTATPKPKKQPTAVPPTAVPPTDVPVANSNTTTGNNGNGGSSNGGGNSGGSSGNGNGGGNAGGNGNGKKN